MRLVLLVCLTTLVGCARIEGVRDRVLNRDEVPAPPAPTRPAPPPSASAPVPTAGAQTVEALDTTTETERAAAAAAPDGAEVELGREVASLGDPTDPGFWIETSLVTETQPGRITDTSGGASALVELRPAGGGGARVSLPALRAIGAPLTDLPEIVVYAR